MADKENMLVDSDVEQALIGCLIVDNEAPGVAQANYDIVPEMFYFPIHQVLVKEIFDLSAARHGYVDAIMVQSRLREKGILSELPDPMYIMQCMEKSPVSHKIGVYCEKVKDLSMKRQLIKIADEISMEAKEAENGQDFLMAVPQRFFDLMPKAGSGLSLADSMALNMQKWRDIKAGKIELPGLSTGIPKLDEVLTGLKPGSYNIIAARPSAGKTSLAGDILDYQCQVAGNGVAWVNMDMPQSDLEQRWQCRRAGVSLPKLNSGHAGEKDFAKMDQAQADIAKWPLHVLHATRDVAKICAWIRLKVKREGVKLVVVDYIQKCTADHIRSYDPVRVIAYASAAIKELCQELNVACLVLAQLARADKKDTRAPSLDSLKGCGDLEQDAQTAMLLYKYPKFDYNNLEVIKAQINEVTQRAIVLDIAKQQNGGIGMMEFWFHTSYFTMRPAPQDWGYPEAVA
jgi:replicative DNA helicase